MTQKTEVYMRLSQTTAGSHPAWSQAAGTGQEVDWASTLDRMVSDTPASALTVTIGVVALAVLAVSYVGGRGLWRKSERLRKERKKAQEQARIDGVEVPENEGLGLRLILMALGGMSVSLYGMWGFATEQAKLPEPFAVGFLAMFDLTELTLFTLLYRRANPKLGWTPQLRLMHNTAWALVLVSATANWLHAPNITAKPFLAVMPVAAAWVIELEFRSRMRGTETAETEKAGPVKLLSMLWEKGWAAVFAGLDLDPESKNGQLIRAALAKKAGVRLFRLRVLLEQEAQRITEGREFKRRDSKRFMESLEEARKKATRSMDRADFALDSKQALAVMRSLGGWTQADDVAMVDHKDPASVVELMERMAIIPAAEAIEAGERAAALQKQAEEAEAARREAVAARERAEEEKRAATAAREEADAAREEAQEAMRAAAEEAERAKADAASAADARQKAEKARKRAEEELSEESKNALELQEQAEEAKKAVEQAGAELAEVRRQIDGALSEKDTAAGQVEELQKALDRLVNERQAAEDTLKDKTEKARLATAEVKRLGSDVATAKQAVEEHIRATEQAADLRRRTEAAQEQAARELQMARTEAAEARALLNSLRPQLAERLGGEEQASALAAAPAFRSEAKQAGWEEYLAAAVEGRELPTAQELAVAYGVSEGNARNWLADFKEKRAAMIVNGRARHPEGETARAGSSRAVPSSAREEPRGYRAEDHGRVEDAEQPIAIGSQRQPA